MKKISVIMLIIAVSVMVVACSKSDGPESASTASQSPSTESPATKSPASKTPSSETPSKETPSESKAIAKYKDGNYDEKGDPWAQGQEEAIVIVKDSKIIEVILRRLDKTGKEIDYTKFDGKEHDGKLYPNLKEFKETMAKKIVEIQSSQVDTISGATVSTGNWKMAVQKALEKAKPKEESKEKSEESKETSEESK